VNGENEGIYAYMWDSDDLANERAAIYGLRSSGLNNPGDSYNVSDTNNAITGYNSWGDSYSFGVAGYTWFDQSNTGGVLGSHYDGGVWGALGFQDGSYADWGVYTPNNAYTGGTATVGGAATVGGTATVGGFNMASGATSGYVLKSDASGNGSWQADGLALPFYGTLSSSSAGIEVDQTGSGNAGRYEVINSSSIFSAMYGRGDNTVGAFRGYQSGDGPAADFDIMNSSSTTAVIEAATTGYGSALEATSAQGGRVIDSQYTGTDYNDAYAVYGKCRPVDNFGYGGYFEGGYYGVYGYNNAVGGGTFTGVSGYVYGGSGTNRGVYGYAGGGSTNWAGYFSGAIYATSASAGIKAFKIDHPLEPESKYLYHSSVESPDMMNIYNGNVILDANGEAWVTLPAWFEALNMEFRYQLTCIGGFAQVYIAEEISGNRFQIAGGSTGLKISWQVTGIRHDPLAVAQRIQVEEDKSVTEAGKYLHPEAYGLSEEMSVEYEERMRVEAARSQNLDQPTRAQELEQDRAGH